VQLCKIMKTSELRGTRLLMRLLTGDPVEAMEAAKQIIGRKGVLAPALLLEVAENRKYRRWSRVGAVYALGFLEFKPSVPSLIRILQDSRESLSLRCHAAEALGNTQDSRAIAVIDQVMTRDEPSSLKKWCIYALSQIGTSQARKILTRVREAKPKGTIAKEIKLALEPKK
jgi:HEAT repeat protein